MGGDLTVQRNWCMPFTYNYVSVSKESVDEIVAGCVLPELIIESPESFFSVKENRVKKILFVTNAFRKEEIKKELIEEWGISNSNILCLPHENELWQKTLGYFENQCEEKELLTKDEHRAIIKSIFSDFAEFCDKHDLRYFLAYGTLIGAVRHKGFIPWDDDIDILMPVEDYKKLIKEYSSDKKYSVLSIEANDDYFFPFAKIVDDSTYLYHHGCPVTWVQGAYIDIFPMSGFKKDIPFETQWKQHTLLDIKWYWYLISRNVIKKKCKDCRKDILNIKLAHNFDESEKIGVLMTIPAKPWILSKEIFGEGIDVLFEGRQYKGPRDYDTYLRAVYGDYMKIPPVEEQRIHGFPSYRRKYEKI